VIAFISRIRLLGFVLAAGIASVAAQPETSQAAQFKQLLAYYAKSGLINGAVLIAQHGQIVYASGFGEADMTTHAPNTPHTKFEIGSITKQFTAALVLQQVEEGHVRLDATLSDYLPWYRRDTRDRITIEQLLHHTSGLPADYDAPAFNATAAGAAHYEPQPFVQKFCQTDLAADPGTKWQYSNCGYDILGLILEQVTGVSYENLLRTKILDPASMRESGFDRNDLVLPNRALGYERHLGPTYTAGPHLDLSHVFAAGAMYSTAEDLLRWNQVLSSDTLFSKRIRDQIFRPGLGNWGYGWFVSTIPAGQPGTGSMLAEMRGDMPGNFFSSISRFADQDAVIIVLRNGYGSSERLEANLQAVLYGQRPRLPMPKPGDLLVHSFQVATGSVREHALITFLAIAGAFSWLALRLRKRSGSPMALT
jgi:CubicO group peptidase (beta-lactamase class C family)